MPNSAGEAFVDVKPNLEEFGPALGAGLGGLLPELGSHAGLLFAGAFGAAILGVGVELFKLGESFETAYDTIRTETGKTGSALQGLDGDFRAVYSNVPAGMQDVADAVGKVAASLGLTGKPLQDVTTDIIDLSRVTKTDLNTNLQLVPALLNNWQIPGKQAGQVLNEIFRASQQTGTGVDTLMQQAAKFGPTFRALNIPLSDGVSIIAQLNKAGIDAGPIMMGLNTAFAKVAKKGGDASQAINDYLTQIKDAPTDQAAFNIAAENFSGRSAVKLVEALRGGQLNYQQLSSSISHGGDTIRSAESDTEHLGEKFTILWHKIQVGLEPVATGITHAMNDGLDAVMKFVPQAEAWLGPRLQAAFGAAKKVFNEFAPDILGGLRGVGNFFSQEWPGVEKTVSGMFSNILPGLKAEFGSIADVVKTVVDMVKAHWPEIEKVLKAVVAAAEPLLVKLAGLWSRCWELFKAVLDPVLAVIKGAWDLFGADILNSIVTVVNGIGTALGGVVSILSGIIDFITGIFTGNWTQAWDGIKEIFGGVWDVIKGAVQIAWGGIQQVITVGLTALGAIWNAAWSVISGVVNTVWSVITGIVNTNWSIITGIFQFGIGLVTGAWNGFWSGLSSVVSGAVGAVVQAVRGVINGVISAINGVISGIDSISIHFSIPGWVPIVGGNSFDLSPNIPHIPELHTGGVFEAPGGRGEGLAMLRTGETVRTTQQEAALTPAAQHGLNIEHLEVNANTNADSHDIATDIGWELRGLLRS